MAAELATPAVASAKPQRVSPQKKRGKQRRAERASKDHSNGGERRGGIEFTLGAATAVLTAGLIGRGAWEYNRLRNFRRDCQEAGFSPDCNGEPAARDFKIATGLSFGFAVPAAVASAFLFVYAVRINRDYKAVERKAAQAQIGVAPSLVRRGAGMTLRMRF